MEKLLTNLVQRGMWVGLAAFVLLNLPARGGERTFLPGLVPAVVAQLTPVGPVPATNRLALAIGLPARNPEALTELLKQMYDPASTNFHHYVTPAQFAARYGPTAADYQKVIEFAETNGLVIVQTYPNRQLVDVAGSVADIERTFATRLLNYDHPTEHRVFYAPNVQPSVPAGMPIVSVSGLNNYALPHPALEPQLHGRILTLPPKPEQPLLERGSVTRSVLPAEPRLETASTPFPPTTRCGSQSRAPGQCANAPQLH